MIAVLLFTLAVAAVHPQAVAELPTGFDGINLGDDLPTVKEALGRSALFRYRGEPDVSFLPKRRETLIESEGFTFIERGLFQFHDDRLYTMVLVINRERMDYFSMFTHFSERYGPPADLSPAAAVWRNERVVIKLERPLSVKYIDLATFTSLRDAARVGESLRELARSEFLELF